MYGNMGVWWDGNMGVWWDGNMGVWWDGSMGVWWDGNMGAWWDGNMATWLHVKTAVYKIMCPGMNVWGEPYLVCLGFQNVLLATSRPFGSCWERVLHSQRCSAAG